MSSEILGTFYAKKFTDFDRESLLTLIGTMEPGSNFRAFLQTIHDYIVAGVDFRLYSHPAPKTDKGSHE